MEKILLNRHTKLRFCRWSRKSYAVFAGMGKDISIGTLRSTVLEKLFLKVIDKNNDFCFTRKDTKDEDSLTDEPIIAIDLDINIKSHFPNTNESYCIDFELNKHYTIIYGGLINCTKCDLLTFIIFKQI